MNEVIASENFSNGWQHLAYNVFGIAPPEMTSFFSPAQDGRGNILGNNDMLVPETNMATL